MDFDEWLQQGDPGQGELFGLEEIFDNQQKLQSQIFGVESSVQSVEWTVDYIAAMVLEASDELHEILNEMQGWKRHHKASGKEYILNRDQVGREARDCLQYLVNIWLAIGWTPEMLYKEYQTKLQVNKARLLGQGGEKCTLCKRGLDDPGAVENCPNNPCIQKG